ncbi:MAG: diguanylate cyclase [Desulfobacteraceae bacterium]
MVGKSHKDTSRKILVVEDSRSVSGFLCRQIEESLEFEAVPAYSLAEAQAIVEEDPAFFVAVLDLNLPDAPDGEIVDYIRQKGIPAVILTATFDEKLREEILGKHVVDYVLKDSQHSLDVVKELIQRIYRNQDIAILLVDPSREFRSYCRTLLEAHKYTVMEAETGAQGLDVLSAHPGILLVITDFNMPSMDGFEFVSRVRERFGKNDVGIIGLSAQGSGLVSAKFLKKGANDFLSKPFVSEEFYARVTQNIELIEFIRQLREIAIRDPLTRLYNRRYYFDAGEKLLEESRETDTPVTVAMIDIDWFKEVNDRFGHDAGDEVLVQLAERLMRTFGKSHIVSRIGGEEFSVLAYGLHGTRAVRIFEDFRRLIESMSIPYGSETVRFTISIGLCCEENQPLAHLIREADRRLYRAKQSGRNRVVYED